MHKHPRRENQYLGECMDKKSYSQGKKPIGKVGYIIGMLMNLLQTNGYLKIINQNKNCVGNYLLDIGCGGGAFINKLVKYEKVKKAYGIDHSEKMIELSNKKNKQFIKYGMIKIERSSVDNLPFNEDMFDTVTALETIQFWPTMDKSIKEVRRVLKEKGYFIIVNRYPTESSRWYTKMQLKNTSEYKDILERCGFMVKKIDKEQRKGWIIVLCEKK